MSKAYRHWILVVGGDKNPLACTEDGQYVVPTNGALRSMVFWTEYATKGTQPILLPYSS